MEFSTDNRAATSGMSDTTGSQNHEGSVSKQAQKRNRPQLSCTNCRHSKLKCDRKQPCSQCIKRGKISQCTLPQQMARRKPEVSMQNRLKHLESLVKDVMGGQTPLSAPGCMEGGSESGSSILMGSRTPSESETRAPQHEEAPSMYPSGNVMLQANEKPTYVGATHWAAILEDIEEVKSYFEDAEEANDEDKILQWKQSQFTNYAPAILPKSGKCLQRNIHSGLSSCFHQLNIHPRYKRFWTEPDASSLSWLAYLYAIIIQASVAILGCGEEFPDLRGTPMNMIHNYRECCVQGLVLSNYTKPGQYTIETICLYTETEFLLSNGDYTHCYLLCGNIIRLAFRMGLHRDATKVGGGQITPFQAEMRRRVWQHMCQIDLLGSTHLGLPGMTGCVASDSMAPKNLRDEDFDEDSVEVPPSRPESEMTPMSYTICKGRICLVATKVSTLANLLEDPPYDQVMNLDRLLHEAFIKVPYFYKLDMTELSITDSLDVIIKKYSIDLLYHSTRCMLHRKFLLKQKDNPEFGYSKVVGLDASIQLLRCQASIHEAAGPGGPLARDRWFLSTLSLHNFLVANMVVYLIIMQSFCGPDGQQTSSSTLTKDQESMIRILQKSNTVWQAMIEVSPEAKKCAAVVALMMKKVRLACGEEQQSAPVFDGEGACELKTANLVSRMSLNGFESTNNSFPTPMDPQVRWAGATASTNPSSGLGIPLEAGLIPSSMDPFGDMVGLPDGFDWEIFDNHIRPQPTIDQPWSDFSQNFAMEDNGYYDL
ncbi:hypothetical protein VTL71DRAFT_10085, partial [Oculimacula yallundae]